ncbi:hypothetical protein Sdia_21180 [Streptomyces diastaticus subsp. diastaticus]|uniref:HTH arsR-type domain-containing protein n=1 Tax=Streptomyces diastaticus subsp. diastaticus TaxID=68040 RepID=A0ABQ1CLX8_STRDI|nr:hypothetical protein Sdia_21180 [Streptomyces diastaticus subsp. diastaticus]GGU11824.1 hypothetical protein GCM10015534_12740 [Streptomyces diastaticus subsp. diastaticus]
MYRPLAVLTTASDIEVLARFGRAPADPIRCRILPSPRDAPACPADLADALGVSRTRLSNHLACLRDCGLVTAAPDGSRKRRPPGRTSPTPPPTPTPNPLTAPATPDDPGQHRLHSRPGRARPTPARPALEAPSSPAGA